jgi:hypothetical protein
MPEIHVTLLGRFAVTVGGVPVAEAGWKRRQGAAVVKVLALARRRERGRILRSRYDTHADVNRGAYDRVVRIYHD